MRTAWLVTGAILFSLFAGQSPVLAADCTSLVPPATLPVQAKRTVTAQDLLALRDIGPLSAIDVSAPILTLSPDGQRVAFQLRQADVAKNTYCLGMFVVDIDKPNHRTEIDTGGDLIRRAPAFFSLVNVPSGLPAPVTPKWSPDGNWVAFLRRDNGVTQVWRARADGTHSEAVTQSSYDVLEFAWSLDGQELIFSGKPDVTETHMQAEWAKEGQGGFLFDDRMIPVKGSRPYFRDTYPATTMVENLDTRTVRIATEKEAARLRPETQEGAPAGANLVRRSASGAMAWNLPLQPDNMVSPEQLQIKWPNGRIFTCVEDACQHAIGLWLSGDIVYYLRREGFARSQMALYEWKSGLSPKRLLLTDAALLGCQMAKAGLICAEESASQPRALVRIDLQTAAMDAVFEPNPEFADLSLGHVQRLFWKNNLGIECFGDLVFPPDHQPGQRHPLIVVGYESRGFLRGTGDEYPVHAFAAQGFTVLSFQRPTDYGAFKGAQTVIDLERMNRQDWADRRSVMSALAEGVRLAVDTGAVDERHVGLTGFSDGAATAQFAMLNSKLFSAVSLSDCCDDRANNTTLLGVTMADRSVQMGYPELTAETDTFWKDYSLSLNADTVTAPLLIQVPDDEYLLALSTFEALRERKRPVDMYVFPDEHHNKWQPVHRAAIYQRNLDWFNFWLRDKRDPDPSKKAQNQHWDKLRSPS